MKLDIVCMNDMYLPCYANDGDACMDLKARVLITDTLFANDDVQVIPPGECVFMGTGIQVSIPEGYVMLIMPRSSTGIKLNLRLANSTGVIDHGYRDEIKLVLHNYGDSVIHVKNGQRLAQFMVIPRPHLELNQVSDDGYFRSDDRGGGVGSTGI